MRYVASVLWLLLLDRCWATECITSAKQVLGTGARHATWSYVDGRHCWRGGYPSATPRHASRGSAHPYGMVTPVPSVPLPPLRYDRLTPEEGRALARELLGK